METFTITIELPKTAKKVFAGEIFELDLANAPVASLQWAALYGLRGLTDAINSAKFARKQGGDDTWLRKDSLAFVDAFMDGSIAERARRTGGTSTVDPVVLEARKLATEDIIRRLGATTWKTAFGAKGGEKYFTQTAKGNITRNDVEVDAFINRADAKGAGFMDAAKKIVAARDAAGDAEADDLL